MEGTEILKTLVGRPAVLPARRRSAPGETESIRALQGSTHIIPTNAPTSNAPNVSAIEGAAVAVDVLEDIVELDMVAGTEQAAADAVAVYVPHLSDIYNYGRDSRSTRDTY